VTPAAGLDFVFGPGVRLRVGGSTLARSHFEREYGPAVGADGAPDVEADVRFALRARAGPTDVRVAGGHKSARWRVALSDPEERPLRARIAVCGGPPSFALSLVQGYYVEPLVSIALGRAGFVGLPSAAVVGSDGALVVMGRSASGKSSLSVRALARGRDILGDDQVVIAGDGGCWSYPRRLRLYPDVEDTAPEAWTRLRRSTRRALRLRRALRWSTRGYVAPSLAVPTSEFRAAQPRDRVPATRLVVLERSADVAGLAEDQRDAEWAAQEAGRVLADQRQRFAAAASDPRWAVALDDTAAREEEIVRAWLDRLPITHLRVPLAWDAPIAVAAVAERLGTDG
jgi:hypothetical protein